MGKPASQAQIDLILKNGWATMEQCRDMTAGQAFKLIQVKLDKSESRNLTPYKSPETAQTPSPVSVPSRDTMMMISYAKDLFIASEDKRTWDACIQMVKDAKLSFEK